MIERRNSMTRAIRTLAWSLLLVGTLGILAPIALILGPQFESNHFPANTDWTVMSATHEGNDLVLAGTMLRKRTCNYDPPPRAFDDLGNTYLIVSRNLNAGRDWPVTGAPQKYGPWVLTGAAGRKVTVYIEHRCHPLWAIVSVLGSYDDRGNAP